MIGDTIETQTTGPLRDNQSAPTGFYGWGVGRIVTREDIPVLLFISNGQQHAQIGLSRNEARELANTLISESRREV